MTFFDGAPAAEPKVYLLDVPREAVYGGTLTIDLRTNPFVPTGGPNPRPLGVSVQRVQVFPGANPDWFVEPSVGGTVHVGRNSVIVGLIPGAYGVGSGHSWIVCCAAGSAKEGLRLI